VVGTIAARGGSERDDQEDTSMSQNQGITGASADAIELLTADHRAVEQLFTQYGAATNDAKVANVLAEEIVRELSIHAVIEEQVLYPTIRRVLPDGDGIADHALQEHQEVKELLADVDGQDASDAEIRATLAKIEQSVSHHVDEEENQLFPALRDGCGQEDMQRMGRAMEFAKTIAPTHPHPNAPNRPPANIVAGLGAAVIDKVRDAAKSIMDR
jgi:hemerythrin superfamily protein